MDLDWCSDEENTTYTKFNEDSVINESVIKKENEEKKNENQFKPIINIEDCFNQNIDVSNNMELLNILTYISMISNHLRTTIRSKKFKMENNYLNKNEFDDIIKYLEWLKLSCEAIKKFFAVPYRKDNSYDPNNKKLFKTSSYKFCNFKESCSIHRNKNKICDKNHFVFDMIINDVTKLIESLTILKLENINYIFDNKLVLIDYNFEINNYDNFKIIENNIDFDINENLNVIDKSLIFKSFDVISYVLNKMYEESYSFLNFNVKSLLITI